MRLFIHCVLSVVVLAFSNVTYAMLNMELTQGVAGAIPIAVLPFAGPDVPQNVSNIIGNDLRNSGRFKVTGAKGLHPIPSALNQMQGDEVRRLGTDNVVLGRVKALGNDRFEVRFELVDLFHQQGKPSTTIAKQYTVTGKELRSVAHHISDLIYESLTGVRGVFSTKIAYVVVKPEYGSKRYILEVADQDGFNPRPLVNSPEPIMSPTWSPTGKEVAYVSFERKRASIYIQNLGSGARRVVSSFPGINGAPAWSPDGRKMAVVLSKTGTPNIYVIDLGTRKLTPVTKDFYINTEPAWAPNGRSLLFTSNRSGGPQIYQANISNGSISRISYDGPYNARASYTKDGKHIAMIHHVSGVYSIGILDLDTGNMRVLTSRSGDTSSPSVAPNGSMVLYDMMNGSRSVLGMVSSDGRVKLMMPSRDGDAQDPAWSPFLS